MERLTGDEKVRHGRQYWFPMLGPILANYATVASVAEASDESCTLRSSALNVQGAYEVYFLSRKTSEEGRGAWNCPCLPCVSLSLALVSSLCLAPVPLVSSLCLSTPLSLSLSFLDSLQQGRLRGMVARADARQRSRGPLPVPVRARARRLLPRCRPQPLQDGHVRVPCVCVSSSLCLPCVLGCTCTTGLRCWTLTPRSTRRRRLPV